MNQLEDVRQQLFEHISNSAGALSICESFNENKYNLYEGLNLRFSTIKKAIEFESNLRESYMKYFNDKDRSKLHDDELREILIDSGYSVHPDYGYKIDGSSVHADDNVGDAIVKLIVAEYAD